MTNRYTITLLVVAGLLTGCGDDFPDGPDDHHHGAADAAVGAACVDDFDCLDQCERGDSFPGGFCTLSCRDDLACTADTVCVDSRDGICLFPCRDHLECDFLGLGYACRERDDVFGRSVFVCLGG